MPETKAETKTKTKKTKYDAGCLLMPLPAPVCASLEEWCETHLDKAQLAPKGIERESHITLRYGLQTSLALASRVLERQASRWDVPLLRLGPMQVFENNAEHDVLVLSVQSGDLQSLYEAVTVRLDFDAPTFPTYVPHITLAYVKKGTADAWIGDRTWEGNVLHLNEIVMSDKNGERESVFIGASDYGSGEQGLGDAPARPESAMQDASELEKSLANWDDSEISKAMSREADLAAWTRIYGAQGQPLSQDKVDHILTQPRRSFDATAPSKSKGKAKANKAPALGAAEGETESEVNTPFVVGSKKKIESALVGNDADGDWDEAPKMDEGKGDVADLSRANASSSASSAPVKAGTASKPRGKLQADGTTVWDAHREQVKAPNKTGESAPSKPPTKREIVHNAAVQGARRATVVASPATSSPVTSPPARVKDKPLLISEESSGGSKEPLLDGATPLTPLQESSKNVAERIEAKQRAKLSVRADNDGKIDQSSKGTGRNISESFYQGTNALSTGETLEELTARLNEAGQKGRRIQLSDEMLEEMDARLNSEKPTPTPKKSKVQPKPEAEPQAELTPEEKGKAAEKAKQEEWKKQQAANPAPPDTPETLRAKEIHSKNAERIGRLEALQKQAKADGQPIPQSLPDDDEEIATPIIAGQMPAVADAMFNPEKKASASNPYISEAQQQIEDERMKAASEKFARDDQLRIDHRAAWADGSLHKIGDSLKQMWRDEDKAPFWSLAGLAFLRTHKGEMTPDEAKRWLGAAFKGRAIAPAEVSELLEAARAHRGRAVASLKERHEQAEKAEKVRPETHIRVKDRLYDVLHGRSLPQSVRDRALLHLDAHERLGKIREDGVALTSQLKGSNPASLQVAKQILSLHAQLKAGQISPRQFDLARQGLKEQRARAVALQLHPHDESKGETREAAIARKNAELDRQENELVDLHLAHRMTSREHAHTKNEIAHALNAHHASQRERQSQSQPRPPVFSPVQL